MAKSKYEPAIHDHKTFLKNARKREGFSKAYNDLEEEYALIHEMLIGALQIRPHPGGGC